MLNRRLSDAGAIARYELMKEALVAVGHPVSELNSADDRQLDWFRPEL